MVGSKQVPILEYEVDGVTKYMPESLDIAKFLGKTRSFVKIF